MCLVKVSVRTHLIYVPARGGDVQGEGCICVHKCIVVCVKFILPHLEF